MFDYIVELKIGEAVKEYRTTADNEWNAIASVALRAALDVAQLGILAGSSPVGIIEGMSQMLASGEIEINVF